MQFAGKTPPTFLAILFVTFFPLQGFFTLVVYMFPRILRYYEEGDWRKKISFFSSFRNNAPKKTKSQKQTEANVSVDERIVGNGESGVDHGYEDEEEKEGVNGNNAKREDNSGDDRQWDGEKDAIDELEDIVDF